MSINLSICLYQSRYTIYIYLSIYLSIYISYICNDMSYLLPLLSHVALKNAPKELDVAEEAVRAHLYLYMSINLSICLYQSRYTVYIYLSIYLFIYIFEMHTMLCISAAAALARCSQKRAQGTRRCRRRGAYIIHVYQSINLSISI